MDSIESISNMHFQRPDKLSSGVNPYLDKLYDFPGRLYPGFGVENESKDLKERLTGHESIVLEFGSGSGGHLINQAERNPSATHIGFEVRFKRAVRTVEKACERSIDNVIIFRNKNEFAPLCIPKQSVDKIFINFPDPWAKKKWFKHRVLTVDSLLHYLPLLKPQGYFSIKTDHPEYFETFLNEVKEKETLAGLRVLDISRDLRSDLGEETDICSEFEKLFRSQNKAVHFCKISRL